MTNAIEFVTLFNRSASIVGVSLFYTFAGVDHASAS